MSKKNLKIAIIGAGSTYTPELIEGLINKYNSLPVKELYLMDIDERKLTIVGGLAQRMIEATKQDTKVVLTMSLDEALINASFVLVQIRVGKLPARILDEKIPLKYNLIGQETNGIGGFFKGMRTIPVMMEMAKRIEELCPDAWLINFSNPSGMLAEAILNNTNVKMLGLCNVPINMIGSLEKRLGLKDIETEFVGLNHLSWITSIKSNGIDYLERAVNEGVNSESMKNIPTSGFSAELIKTVKAIPSPYLEYYYYKDEKLRKAKEAEKSRGEICVELEEGLLKQYQCQELHEKPAELSKRGGARYSEVAINLVNSIYNDIGDVQVVNCLNKGALSFMDDNDAVEVCAKITKDGAIPLKVKCDNEHIIAYTKMVKAYEKHAVKAALTGDEDEAMKALLINPLVGDYKLAKPCFEELKEAHKAYLPQFFKEKK